MSFSIIFGSVVIATVALYYVTGMVAASAAKISADRTTIQKQSGNLAILANLKAQEPQAETYQAAMNQLMPTEDNLIVFSQWVNTIAANHQVVATVSLQGTTGEPAGSTPGISAFSIDASGAQSDLLAFLQDMELKTPGFFVQLTSFDLIDNNPTYELKGQGQLFFRS